MTNKVVDWIVNNSAHNDERTSVIQRNLLMKYINREFRTFDNTFSVYTGKLLSGGYYQTLRISNHAIKYENMFYTDASGEVCLYTPSNEIYGNLCIMLYGYDEAKPMNGIGRYPFGVDRKTTLKLWSQKQYYAIRNYYTNYSTIHYDFHYYAPEFLTDEFVHCIARNINEWFDNNGKIRYTNPNEIGSLNIMNYPNKLTKKELLNFKDAYLGPVHGKVSIVFDPKKIDLTESMIVHNKNKFIINEGMIFSKDNNPLFSVVLEQYELCCGELNDSVYMNIIFNAEECSEAVYEMMVDDLNYFDDENIFE